MRSKTLLLAGVAMLVGWSAPRHAAAQTTNETRVVTFSTWNVPYTDRGPFMRFFRNRVLPNWQLNPNVINSRLLFHQYGSEGDQIVLVNEFASLEALAAGCGQPCTDYFEAHPAPEEGEEGYEAFHEGQQAFLNYYSHHADEIYGTPMEMAKVDGEVQGRIGPAPDEGDN